LWVTAYHQLQEGYQNKIELVVVKVNESNLEHFEKKFVKFSEKQKSKVQNNLQFEKFQIIPQETCKEEAKIRFVGYPDDFDGTIEKPRVFYNLVNKLKGFQESIFLIFCDEKNIDDIVSNNFNKRNSLCHHRKCQRIFVFQRLLWSKFPVSHSMHLAFFP
jgi:hypothetical protein